MLNSHCARNYHVVFPPSRANPTPRPVRPHRPHVETRRRLSPGRTVGRVPRPAAIPEADRAPLGAGRAAEPSARPAARRTLTRGARTAENSRPADGRRAGVVAWRGPAGRETARNAPD